MRQFRITPAIHSETNLFISLAPVRVLSAETRSLDFTMAFFRARAAKASLRGQCKIRKTINAFEVPIVRFLSQPVKSVQPADLINA